MGVSEQLAARIRERVAERAAAPNPDPIATALAALPLDADMGGCIALRPDGELILVHGEQDGSSPTEWTEEIEPEWRIAALAAGSRRYPELADLLPTKGPDDIDCPDCGGAGTWSMPDGAEGPGCGCCWGLGWRSGV